MNRYLINVMLETYQDHLNHNAKDESPILYSYSVKTTCKTFQRQCFYSPHRSYSPQFTVPVRDIAFFTGGPYPQEMAHTMQFQEIIFFSLFQFLCKYSKLYNTIFM